MKRGDGRMIVLVVLQSSPVQRYIARLLNDELVREVRDLVSSKKHSEAITAVLTKGRIKRVISKDEIHDIKADLILSEKNARWDLVK